MKTAAYYAGLEAKMVEIKGMGWAAARDKFNAENPPGQRWTGSAEGLQYAQGEFEALVQTHPTTDGAKGMHLTIIDDTFCILNDDGIRVLFYRETAVARSEYKDRKLTITVTKAWDSNEQIKAQVGAFVNIPYHKFVGYVNDGVIKVVDKL